MPMTVYLSLTVNTFSVYEYMFILRSIFRVDLVEEHTVKLTPLCKKTLDNNPKGTTGFLRLFNRLLYCTIMLPVNCNSLRNEWHI